MSELLPCPFCGSRNVAQGASKDRISVWCDCGARGPDVAFPADSIDPVTPIKECHALWNRRAPSPSPAPGVEEALHNAKVLLKALTGPDDAIAGATLDGIETALASLSQPAKGEREGGEL